jgi:glutamyl-tRNA reductase
VTVEAGVLRVGTDHRSAPLWVLERMRQYTPGSPGPVQIQTACSGGVLLSTCHRHELYLEGVEAGAAPGVFAARLGCPLDDLREVAPYLEVQCGASAARHLLRVAAGLESAVLGEDQVLAQVRQAYRAACERRSPGPALHRLFHAAFRAGRRVRSETELGTGVRSLAGAAVVRLEAALGTIAGRTFVVIGAGEMASLAAHRLHDRGAGRIIVANRTRARAGALAAEVQGETCEWAWRRTAVREADGVVCAVSTDRPVVPAAWLVEWAERRRTAVAIADLGVPRNVDAPDRPPAGVVLVDMAALSAAVAEADERRRAAVVAAEAIVEYELADWVEWTRARSCWERASRREPLAS